MRSLVWVAMLVGGLASACQDGARTPSGPAGPVSRALNPATEAGFCHEHGVPEALCTKCNPALIPVFKARGDWCDAHGFPESYCPVCHPNVAFPDVSTSSNAGRSAGALESQAVRLRSPHIEDVAGIKTVPARSVRAAPSVMCTARIAFDTDRIADVRSIVPGIVRRARVQLGAQVKRGAPLFDLESTRVGEIQGALQTARERVRVAGSNLARKRTLRAGDIASARQVEVAEQALATADAEKRIAAATLRLAGAAQADPSGRYTLRAPIAGTVVRRPAVVGLLATESTSLATIGDTSVMWALCDVPEADASRIRLDQEMSVTVDGTFQLKGRVTWIAAEVDARTRTVTARAELANPEGRLRANQFARARIQTGASQTRVSVPRDAIQRVEEHEVVFVRTKAGVYEPRVVRTFGGGRVVQVEGRVQEGDAVVTTGAVLLRTELMPGSIGAGCCVAKPPGGR